MATPAITPQQSDPFAEFGGVAASAVAPTVSAPPASTPDPFAEFGGVAASGQQPQGAAPGSISERSGPNDLLSKSENAIGEATNDVWSVAKGMAQHPIATVAGIVSPGAVSSFEGIKDSISHFQEYEKARSQGKGILDSLRAANDQANKESVLKQVLDQRIKDVQKNGYTQEGIRTLLDAAAAAAAIYATKGLGPEAVGAEESAADAATAARLTPETEAAAPKPGIVKQIIGGKNVNQPGAQAAVRSGVQAGSEAAGTADESIAANIKSQPLVKGPNTVLDEHMSALQDSETAAYKTVDDAAGFDVKAEKQQLANDQYKLKQLGNTDADVTARGNLIESINDSTDRIAQAEAKMKAAGIDPKAADAIHQQRMAGMDFKKSLIKNTNPADGSVNVEGLLKESKNLRFTKYGDRLQQFMGKEGADNYFSQLEDMQKLGAHAVTARKVAAWVAAGLGLTTLAGGTVAKVAHVGAALLP